MIDRFDRGIGFNRQAIRVLLPQRCEDFRDQSIWPDGAGGEYSTPSCSVNPILLFGSTRSFAIIGQVANLENRLPVKDCVNPSHRRMIHFKSLDTLLEIPKTPVR